MAHFNPRMLIPVALISTLGAGGWYVDAHRARTRSVLSGYFESQPSELASRITGRVERIDAREGDTVKRGQVLVVMEAAPTHADAAAKDALAKGAEAQLRETLNGPRVEDLHRQEAVVAETEANLAKLRNGSRPEEIAAASAKLRQTEAMYRKAMAGARPQEIAAARAAEAAARARLAQSERGLTPEEIAEAKARLDVALAQENLSKKELTRTQYLLTQGAISRQQVDVTRANEEAAEARRKELDEAFRRAREGTPKEEMDQAREAYRQAQANRALVEAGSRPQDIEAARAEVAAARANLTLLQKGSRPEDIRAAEARLSQAQTMLAELRAGNRKEQIAQAKAAAQAAAANVQGAKANLEERVIRAPEDGVLERILIAVGDLVSAGMPVVRINDPRNLWIRIYLPEGELAKVNTGDDGTLHIDGVPRAVPATVESIATRGEFTPANLQTPDERGKQVFAVRLRLKRSDLRIKAGMFATVQRVGQWP